MQNSNKHSAAARWTLAGLLMATLGVVMQILAGASYPTVPPVFFILLIPAGLLAFGSWKWRAVPAIIAGLFLTFGLFASGASARLIVSNNISDTSGLWLQTIAVLVAVAAGIVATVRNYSTRTNS